MPFTYDRRRREVKRLLSQEFGMEADDSIGARLGRTPERGKRWISGWFFDTPYEEIDRNMICTFLAWAWFNHEHVSELSDQARSEVEADIAAIEVASGQTFRATPFSSSPQAPQGLEGRRRSRGLTSMRPNVDGTAPFHAHHPLFLYVLTQVVIGSLRQRRVLSSLGFERITLQVERTMDDGTRGGKVSFSYWHRPAMTEETPGGGEEEGGSGRDEKEASAKRAADPTPIVLYHGIGLGWGHSYPPLLRDVVRRADKAPGGRPILAVELPHVSLTIPTDYGPSPVDAVRATCAMLRRHGVGPGEATSRADFVGHSYGSIAVAHVLKQRPAAVRSAALVDPVCVGAHRATLCRSFLYEPLLAGQPPPSVSSAAASAAPAASSASSASSALSASSASASASARATPRPRLRLADRFMGWFLHSDPRLVGVLMRNFLWFENVLWLDDEEIDAGAAAAVGDGTQEEAAVDGGCGSGEIALFVAEGDKYLDGRTIYDDAQEAIERRRRGEAQKAGGSARRTLRAVLWGDGQDHGEWLGRPEQRREVIDVVMRGPGCG